MRKRSVGLIFLAVACSGSPKLPRSPDGAAVLEVRGAVKHGPYALGRGDLERLPRGAVRGVDPAGGDAALFEGPSVAAVVSERVEVTPGADTVIVRTGDHAAVPVPLTMIRQLKPVLAERKDGVHLTPRVLAWPNAEQRAINTDPRARSWWARDVLAFEIVDWQRTYGPALAAPVGASDDARRGSAHFAERCVSCHKVRGAGGARGPDLTTVAARMRAEPFSELLTGHPGMEERAAEEPAAQRTIEVWTFLRAVATVSRGERPGEELAADRSPPEPETP